MSSCSAIGSIMIRPKCLQCRRCFHSFSSLQRHSWNAHSSDCEKFACSHCSLEIHSFPQLKAHALTAHSKAIAGNYDNTPICGVCNCYVLGIWEHIRSSHLCRNSKEKECQMCGEVVQKREWKQHCELQHPSVPCYLCQAVFSSVSSYTIHFNDIHVQATAITCGLCGRQFHHTEKFARHVFAVHLKVRCCGYEVCLHCWELWPLEELKVHYSTQHAYIQCLRYLVVLSISLWK